MIFYQSSLNLYTPKGHILDLFWSNATRRIAQTFIIIFSAVYIYQSFIDLGFSYAGSITLVCLFYTIFLGTKLLFLSIAENASIKTGFKGMIWLSAVPFAFFIPAIIYAKSRPIFFFVAAAFYGAHSSFYWWGYHGYFIKTQDRKHYGGGIGASELLYTIVGIAAPILGGIIIEIFGFSFLYALAGSFMFLSLILLGKGNDTSQRKDVIFKDVVRNIVKLKSVSSAYFGSATEAMFYTVAWPLFLFFTFKEVLSLGAFVSVSALFAAILGVFIGNKIDKEGERGVVTVSSPAFSFSWLLKAASVKLPILIVADSIRNFSGKLLDISLIELTYKKASEAETAMAIMFRELAIISGSFIGLLLIVVVTLLGFELRSLFVIISLFALFPLIPVFRKRI